MEENTYPIKYAIMPVTNYAKNDNFILGYIVSKVYVTLETNRYYPTGVKSSYDVVFPVKGIKSAEVMMDLRKPEYDANGMCINADHSSQVFETFDEAKNVCTEMNNTLFRTDIANYTARTNQMADFELKVLEKTYNIPNPEDIKKNTR